MVNVYDPALHQIRETPQAAYLQKTFDKSFFTYFQPDAETWVVSFWVKRDRGQFVELLILKDIKDMNREQVRDLEAWVHKRTPTVREKWKEVQSQLRDRRRQEADDKREAAEGMKYIAKKLRQEGNPAFEGSAFKANLNGIMVPDS